MRPLRPLLLGTLLLAGAGLPALAQTPPAPPPGAAPPAAGPARPGPAAQGPGAQGPAAQGPAARGPGAVFARVDANADGRVTFEEVWTFAQSRYAEADRNRDGALVLEEALAFRPMPPPDGAAPRPPSPMHARMAAALFRAVDVNSDGRVTLEEIRPALEAQFRALDANGDRGVTLDELPVGHRGMHRGPHGHGGPGHGGPGQGGPGMPGGPGAPPRP